MRSEPNLNKGSAWQCYHVAVGKKNSEVLLKSNYGGV